MFHLCFIGLIAIYAEEKLPQFVEKPGCSIPEFKGLKDATDLGYEAYKQEVIRYMDLLGSSGKAQYTLQFEDLKRPE